MANQSKYQVKYRMHKIEMLAQHPAYEYWHEDFEGEPDSPDCRCGTAKSVDDCKKLIDEYWNSIDWLIGEQFEVLKNDYAVFSVTGKDENGHEYEGVIHTFISDPKIDPKDEVMDIQTQ